MGLMRRRLFSPTSVAGFFASLALFLLPTLLARSLVALVGWSISTEARVGFSWVGCRQLVLQGNSRIGHFNFIILDRYIARTGGRVGNFNIMRGPLSVRLGALAKIGNRNVVTRAPKGVTRGTSRLWLSDGAVVTASHSLDCAKSVSIGAYSHLAGKGSQIWTHGYVHDQSGPGRYRIDGYVDIGDNVYVGAGVIITGGVRICDATIVGAGACVARSIEERGFYVSTALRRLDTPTSPDTRNDLREVIFPGQLEQVFEKHRGH